MDYCDLMYVKDSLKLLGSKGTTGNTGKFYGTFSGDTDKVKELENKIAKDGFQFMLSCIRSDLQPQGRYKGNECAGRNCIMRNKIFKRHKASCAYEEIEEPFEKNSDRFIGNGV